MTPKQTTINTVTLTCSTCGSAQFTKLATNEYRCNHCQAMTLVEDDVAQRLEKILRGMQQPASTVPVKPTVITAVVVGVVAAAVISLTAIFSSGSSSPPRRLTPVEPPIDASLVKLTDIREIQTRSRKQLIMMVRNETGRKIDAPRITATFYQDDLTLSSSYDSPSVRSLQPGEYAPVRINVTDKAYTRYTLQVATPSAARGKNNDVAASKVQLVKNDGSYRLIGLVKNQGAATANSTQISVMLYGEDGALIGTGNGYASAGALAPGALTSFDVSCEMLNESRVASYDYMVQSES